MVNLARVCIHQSQFPAQVRAGLLRCLRDRKVAHKFHYDSEKQAARWLAMHESLSPFRTQSDVAALYEAAAKASAQRCAAGEVCFISLGCGGGKKDRLILLALQNRGQEATYVPSDVSTAMVLAASETISDIVPPAKCLPLVWDMAETADWKRPFAEMNIPGPQRIFSFFGMLPNFEPFMIDRLAALMRPGDILLASANLAPGKDYPEGVRNVLPLYDNPQTRHWLMAVLSDLGMDERDGEMRFAIREDTASSLLRIESAFCIRTKTTLRVDGNAFTFLPGEELSLFFSYRHTPDRLVQLARNCGLEVEEQWIAKSGEEGVFLLSRKNESAKIA